METRLFPPVRIVFPALNSCERFETVEALRRHREVNRAMRKGNIVSTVSGIAVLVLGLMVVAAPASVAGASMPAASTAQAAAVYGTVMIGGNVASVNMVNNLSAMHIGIPIYAAHRAAFQMARSP
jgi:hypothetical protein